MKNTAVLTLAAVVIAGGTFGLTRWFDHNAIAKSQPPPSAPVAQPTIAKPPAAPAAQPVAIPTPEAVPVPAQVAPAPPESEDQSTIEPVRPDVISHTVSLMPGQATNFSNTRFRKVEIHSEFPIRAFMGHCRQEYTVEFLCETEPADLFVVDTRKPPVFMTPRANLVTITLVQF
jgi:hypothetical protein